MSETPERPVAEQASADLVREAAELRRSLQTRLLAEAHRGPGLLYRLVALLVLAAALGGAFTLLLVDSWRRQAVEHFASLVAPEAVGSARLYSLPPPPPEPAVAKMATVIQGGAPPTGEVEGVLYATIPGPEQAAASAEEQQPEFQQVPKTPEAEAALIKLRELSEVAAGILDGNDERYEFVEWRLVRNAPPRFWLDLVVKERTGGAEVHLVYEVDVDGSRIRPLSQAARDLSR
ncbi:MAG: hypothetical protein Kow00109_23270 [Acidobacteriota bacterium]